MSSTELRVKELLRQRGWTTKVLAEKTGMSESYLTHIKNGTRRWNEDALKKLAKAFELHPIDLFLRRKTRTEQVVEEGIPQEQTEVKLHLKIVPAMGQIPANPSPYNNQLTQITTGYKDVYVPVFNSNDDAMFCLVVENNAMSGNFVKGDYLIISPEAPTKSGDIAAVEFGNELQQQAIMHVTFMDDFVVLEAVNHKQPPIALIRGKDHFRIIGKVIHRYQRLG